MKKVIDGKTYNTDTARLIVSFDHEDGSGYTNLYKTKDGLFFVEGEGDGFSLYKMPASEPDHWIGGSGIRAVYHHEVPGILEEAEADEDEWILAGFTEEDYERAS